MKAIIFSIVFFFFCGCVTTAKRVKTTPIEKHPAIECPKCSDCEKCIECSPEYEAEVIKMLTAFNEARMFLKYDIQENMNHGSIYKVLSAIFKKNKIHVFSIKMKPKKLPEPNSFVITIDVMLKGKFKLWKEQFEVVMVMTEKNYPKPKNKWPLSPLEKKQQIPKWV